MKEENVNKKIVDVVSLCVEYCVSLENAREMERDEFIDRMLYLLPRIYWHFNDLAPESASIEEYALPEYVDEDYYDNIMRRVSALMAEDDTYLETFEEDMKYSDTPIAASISECLADVFQPLFNFVERVRESDGDSLLEAYIDCRESFASYWSRVLCNVLRALNALKYR